MTNQVNYWLMKSEPNAYSIHDLQRDRETIWDGVRNYQARNFLRQMNLGDLAFFYHSNATPPGIAGLMRICQPNIADPTQFDPNSPYYDEKSTVGSPRWQTVRVEFVETFPHLLSLETLKQKFNEQDLGVIKGGNRLSVMPVDAKIAKKIMAMIENQSLNSIS